MNGFRLSLIAALLAATSLPAQEVGSDAPAESPLAGLERIDSPRDEAENDRVQGEVHFLQARLALGRGDKAEALRHYQRAWRWDPRQAALLPEIVKLAFQLKRNDEAARYAALAADGDLSEPLLLRRLATHLTERRDWARALKLYEQAQRLEDKRREASRQARQDKPDLGAAIIRREMGRLYFLTGDFARSAESFAYILGAIDDPESSLSDDAKQLLLDDAAQTYRLWAEAFLAAGKLDVADDLFRRAHKDKSNPALLAYQLARVAAKRGDAKMAQEKLGEYFAAKSDAAGTAPFALLAELIAGETRDASAARKLTIERLEQLIAADGENLALKQALAEQYVAAKDDVKAEPLLAAIVAKQPDGDSAGQLAGIYRRSHQPEKLLALAAQSAARSGSLDSLGAATAAIAADKALVKKLAELARQEPDDPGALFAAGLLALEAKDFDAADELLAAAKASRSPPQAATYWRWGLALLLANESARAAQVFQRMLDEKIAADDEADTQFYLSAALALADRTDEALAAAKRAAELRPSDPRVAARIGWIWYQANRLDEAREAYVDFLEQFDRRIGSPGLRDAVRDARLALSNIDLERGDYPAATEWLQEVLDEFPEDTGAGNDLGYLWADHGEHLQRALVLIERAARADPNNSAYRDSLGWVYFRLNRPADAVRELEQAAAGESTDGVILEHLGEALLKLGRRGEAVSAFRRAEAAFQKGGKASKLESLRTKIRAVE